jgi:Flp pilus assembly protein TadD
MFTWNRRLEKHGIEPGQAIRMWLPTGCALALAVAAFWIVLRRSEVNFLSNDSRAKWIIYPSVPSLGDQPDGPRQAVFKRKFRIADAVVDGQLIVRGMTAFTVSLNGTEIARSDTDRPPPWNTISHTTIGPGKLAVGENELVATVTCHRGPPALWLALDTGVETIATDAEWQASLLGAVLQPARLAASIPPFGPGSAPADAERPLKSLVYRWRTFLSCGLIAAVAVGVLNWYGQRSRAAPSESTRCVWLLIAAIAGAWLVLLMSNSGNIPFALGYDAELHLDYVQYLQQHGTIPRGNEGLEMWQPPLYYAIASLLTSLARAPAKSETAVLLLRAFSYFASLAQLLLVAGCLRRLYPGRSWAPPAGLILAGCVPMQLYLMHYASNDVLAALLATASLYAAMVVIQQRRTSIRTAVMLGVCLGAATITKLSAWPVVLTIIVLLVWQCLVERHSASQWFMRLVVPALTAALVCGWYFLRNYQNFGQPLPPDQAGFAYGQDPGYATAGQFLRFGRSLTEPFFSAFAGVPDGIYSTLWGDGDWGGQTTLEGRPPWNYDLMAAGYLVALVPSMCVVVGIGAVLWQVTRGWRPEKLLVLAASAASFCGISYFYLRHPMYGAVKAHYAFASITSLSMFLAEGYLVLAGNTQWRRLMLSTAIGTWGLASLATFLIAGSSSATQAWIGRQLALQGNIEPALTHMRQAMRKHPDDVGLQVLMGRILHRAERNQEALAELNRALSADPEGVELQLSLAQVLNSLGQHASERTFLLNVVRLAPDDPRGHVGLAHNFAYERSFQETIRAAREGLRVSPIDPRLHVLLAEALLALGHTDEAVEHYRIVLNFKPDDLPALTGLASILAMHPNPAYRNAARGLELAQRASELTERTNPLIEDILAAAYAEAGNFPDAEKTLRAVLEHLTADRSEAAGGAAEIVDRLTKHLDTVRSQKPLREPAFNDPREAVPD